MQHLWIRELDAHALRRVRAMADVGRLRVFADTVTSDAVAALARQPLPEGTFEMAQASMAIEDGGDCNIRARAETIGACLIRRATGEPEEYRWLVRSMRRWGPEWLRIVGAHYVEHGPKLSDYLAFVENRYRSGAVAAPERLIVDLGRHEVAAAYAAHAARLLDVPFPVHVRGTSPEPLLEAARILGRQLLQLLYLLLRWLTRGRTAEVKITARGKGVVLVGFERGMMGRLPLGATVDWFEFSELPPERIVFLFNRSNSPLDEEARALLKRCGFGWADCSSVSRLDHRAFVGLLCALAASIRMLPAPWSRAALRRWTIVAQLHPLVNWHRTFVRENGAVAFFQGAQFTPSQMALNLACRQEQVAVVWSFWSVMLLLEQACHHAFVDLLIGWGDYDVGYSRALSFDYRYFVKTGVVTYDGAEADDVERAVALRARLTSKPRFTLAIFDSAHEPRGIHHSDERCAEFYRVVLALVRDNPDWGCLIKSKARAYDELSVQPGLQDVVAELEAQGRCLRLPNATKPTLTALAADAVVCYSVNSAGIQASIGSGRPVLHFDNNHLLYHPLASKPAAGASIFRDGGSLVTAIQRVAAGEREIGGSAPWAPLIDPFRDGYGRKRAAVMIRDYIAARDGGATMSDALDTAVSQYRIRYGARMASTRTDGEASDGDRLWQNTRARFYSRWPEDFPYQAISSSPMSATY